MRKGDATIKAEVRDTHADATMLTLKMEEGPINQGVQVVSKSWNGQGKGFSLRASGMMQPFWNFDVRSFEL